ncbi:hypothetical protein I9H06_24025 [Pseudomonas tremae]|uniref:hypothetical protein n=1 Tax=Pseudomonas tremae TaxID=200454 RepID=UPI001F27DDCA|nr:hypothetical protein [Pseudomonas tremae]MCF5711432.1 hypothetical protein [Pseudomonas tremae]UQB31308.1 hypothetical protein I9H06_24025 [Pseudomonas tremae]
MIDLNALRVDGFVEVEGIESKEHLIEIAKSIGKCLPNPDGSLISTVRANNGVCARPGTFSHAYGLSPFPMHTDTAYCSLPVRYLVLGMLKPSEASTRYINIKHIIESGSANLLKLARESIYLVETFEQAKYTSAVFSSGGVTGVRYDPNIMTPANKPARKFDLELADAIRGAGFNEVYWPGNKAVILDNWECLHGRSKVAESNREILRIYLE